MKLPIAGIDWDEGNREHCQKHGISLRDIETLLKREDLVIVADFKHSGQQEQRFIASSFLGARQVFIGFTLRAKEGGIFIRPVSVRYMREKEARRYAQETTSPRDQ